MIGWACAVQGCYPPDLMEFLYLGIFGTNKSKEHRSSEYMSSKYKDSGLTATVRLKSIPVL
jgi:hypothetical protein